MSYADAVQGDNGSQNIFDIFDSVKIDTSWAFAGKTTKDTNYITHGYHRYPAKFIPQVASRLIDTYSEVGDMVADPFGGCGTTLIESKVMQRHSIGVDINPVAVLITGAKIISIDPSHIEDCFSVIKSNMDKFDENTEVITPQHERIDYWFKEVEKRKLAFICSEIDKVKNKDVQNFFYCGFSNILKNCSIWLQKSNKPTRDFNKIPADPFKVFSRQIKKMARGNIDFYNMLNEQNSIETNCSVFCEDARNLSAPSNSVNLVITSPPYVTSYEYADLHQLTALWFEYTANISTFRKRFIGTSHHGKKEIFVNSKIGEDITIALDKKHKKTATEVATYFSEMNQVFKKMHDALQQNGKACIVIGNTALKGEKILNAEVFTEQMLNIGFDIESIIKREIPSKSLPSTRDKGTGRFVKASSDKKILAYPTEYILVMRKK